MLVRACVLQLGFDRATAIREAEKLLQGFDAIIYPTCAIVAPTIEEVDRSDDEYSRVNLLLLRNTGLMNMLDGCAATLPCPTRGEPPVGLSVAGLANSDKHILSVAQGIELALAHP